LKNTFRWTLNKLVVTGACAYVLLILLFMLNSGLVRVSGNVLLNKSLDVLFFTVAAVVGYGVLLLFEKVLNLRMLNKEYARILIVVLMTLITRLVWIHIVDITPKVILSCTILWRRHSRGERPPEASMWLFFPIHWLSLYTGNGIYLCSQCTHQWGGCLVFRKACSHFSLFVYDKGVETYHTSRLAHTCGVIGASNSTFT